MTTASLKPAARSQTARTGHRLLHTALAGCAALSLAQLLASPARAAITFDSPAANNPFYFNGNSNTSSWELSVNGTTRTNWGDLNSCDNTTQACVTLIPPGTSAFVYGSGNAGDVTAWISKTPNQVGGNSRGYLVSFSGSFTVNDGAATAQYTLDGLTYKPLGATFNESNILVGANDFLTFNITNSTGYGDLQINNFSATAVPEPVLTPLAFIGAIGGLGAARRRRTLLSRKRKADDAQSKKP